VKALAAVFLLLAAAAPLRAAGGNVNAEDALRESVLRLAAGDVGGAEVSAREATEADHSSVRALQQLARAANAALHFDAAEDAATRGLALTAPTPALYCLRSEARAGRGDYQGALEDADKAARLNPASAQAALRSAVAKEGLRRSPGEILSDYRRAAELDASLARLSDAAAGRLGSPSRPRRGLGMLIGLLGLAALIGWLWGLARGRGEPAPVPRSPAPEPVLPAGGILSPREASRMLAVAARGATDPDSALALAESLYERLTGRPAFAPEEAAIARGQGRFVIPSKAVEGLPVGIDAFFTRALAPKADLRFRNGAELAGAFRSLVDPAVD
jgi:tetratricopeptide (TPR) repeat protein